ncbi:MAG TPA: serine hydrolase domain-containing protein [Longimicrobiales bacterium]
MAAVLVATMSCAGTRRALPTASPENLGLSAEGLRRISTALQGYVDAGKVSGIYAVIARRGQIGYEQTFGLRDLQRRDPMTRNAVFRIYSMTKPVVGAGALLLVDQRKISLDDPVSKYIPAFANVKVYAGGSADAPQLRAPDSIMTVRHLLTHTSGLPYGLTNLPVDTIFRRASLYNASSTLAQFADSIARIPLLFSPGSAWSYSSALEIVGRIIEVASGKTLDRFLDDELFTPLGMRETTFRMQPALQRRLATLYAHDNGGPLQEVRGGLLAMYEPDARFLWGSGGLLSTPDDYLRFAQMLLNGGELDGRRILSRQSVSEMMRNQLPAALTPVSGPPMMDEGYGQGLAGAVLVDSARAALPGSPGIYRWSGYVGTYFWIDPRNELIAMVWTQLSPGRAYPLEQDFQKLVYAALQR